MGKFTWVAGILAVIAVCVYTLTSSLWWCTLSMSNGASYEPTIDWDRVGYGSVTAADVEAFRTDGALHMAKFFPAEFIRTLDPPTANVMGTHTFIQDIFRPMLLPHYKHYAHYVHTYDPVLYDWAMYGPFAKVAQALIGSDTVRLYNVELIVRDGDKPELCNGPVWHRDTLASPGRGKTAIFNVYLQDIDDQSDGLIFCRGSAGKETGWSEYAADDIIRHNVTVGDVVVHDGDVLHATTGVGCFGRKSLQFRYIDGAADYSFDTFRLPSVWHWAHAPKWAAHGLTKGMPLASPYYPQVYPKVLAEEHVPVQAGSFRGIVEAFGGAKPDVEDLDVESYLGYGAFEGIVRNPHLWELHDIFGVTLKAGGVQV